MVSKNPTIASQVQEVVQKSDDFVTIDDIQNVLPNLERRQIVDALAYLQHHKVVEKVWQNGVNYFLASINKDDRMRTCASHEETHPRRAPKPKNLNGGRTLNLNPERKDNGN